LIRASQILESISSLNEAVTVTDIQGFEKKIAALVKRIEKVKTPEDYSSLYFDWREWGQEFGDLLHVRVLGKTWSGNPLAMTNQDLDVWYDKTMALLDDIEWLLNPHVVTGKRGSEPDPKAVEAWIKDSKRVKSEVQKLAKTFFTELKKTFKKLGEVPDHYLTTEEEISGVQFTSIIAEHDEGQKQRVADIKKGLENSAKILKRFGFGMFVSNARAAVNFQVPPPEMEFACSYNVTKDLLMMGRVRPGFFWERVILQAFGERSWYQFLKREAQTDWYNFVAKNKVRLTEEELSEIQKIFLRYSENGSLPRDLEPILIPKIKESPIFRKAEAILRTYLLTLSSDDSGEMTEFLDYIPRFVTEYFSFFEAAHYVTAFSSLRGTDLVVLSWADTLTRYVLEARLDPFVEFEFMRIAGIKK
jgi:hypothetical protein